MGRLSLRLDRDVNKLWILVDAMNSEGANHKQIKIKQGNIMLTEGKAANSLTEYYANANYIDITREQKTAMKHEQSCHHNTETVSEEHRQLVTRKKKKPLGKDGLTNEMLI